MADSSFERAYFDPFTLMHRIHPPIYQFIDLSISRPRRRRLPTSGLAIRAAPSLERRRRLGQLVGAVDVGPIGGGMSRGRIKNMRWTDSIDSIDSIQSSRVGRPDPLATEEPQPQPIQLTVRTLGWLRGQRR